MSNQKTIFYFLVVLIFTTASCKSCKNKFSKHEPEAKATSYEDSLYAGLDDTTSNTASINTSADGTSTTDNSAATTNVNNTTPTSNSTAETNKSEKKLAADVENESNSKYSSKRKRGVSSSIYDGINDQEERYVVRKAEGYNDAYYIDDYNGTNKFYEEHYKKASKLEKPITEYIDKSMNLPTSAYAKGVTQKSVDATIPKPVVVETKAKVEEPKGGGTGSIGIPKKPNTKVEKPKNAQEMLNKKN
ncbi:MAG: hypothetical protein RIQ33_2373 [Bacteroidota bacterium]|jgi:hypothetical protein